MAPAWRIHCEEVWTNFERFTCPKPQTPPIHKPLDPSSPGTPRCTTTAPACNHRLSCSDEMEGETAATGKTTDGICPSSTTANAQRNRAARIADYEVDKYEAIARDWLASSC